MGTEESNRSATPYKILITQDETLNKPLPPHWSTPTQVYHNSGSNAAPFINSYAAGFSLHPNIWANQEYSTPLQYDPQHDPRSLSSHFVVYEKENKVFSVKRKWIQGNYDPRSIITRKSRENGNGSPMPKSARDGSYWRSCVSSGEGHDNDDTNNVCRSLLKDFLTKKQRCDVVPANGNAAEKEAIKIDSFNTIHVNRNSTLEDIAVNSTELNANLGTCPNVIRANPRLSKLQEENEIRRERKRQLNRESARRSRIRKQLELEELQNTVDNIMSEISFLKKKLMSLSEDCVELTDSNDSVEKELIEKYGPEIIADLVATKPARICC